MNSQKFINIHLTHLTKISKLASWREKGLSMQKKTKEEFCILHTVAMQIKDRYELLFLLLSA
jgi:hypothetical protein